MNNENGNQDLSDEEAVDISPDLKAAMEREAAQAEAKADPVEEDEDDFDLLGDEDDNDDDPVGEEGDEDEGEGDDVDEDVPVKQPVRADSKPGKQTAKERIEELAEKRRQAEAREFEAELKLAEREKALEEMEARLRKLESGEIKQIGREPKPDDYEFGKADEKYADDMIEWRLQKERSEWNKTRETETQQAKNEALIEHYKAQYAKTTEAGHKKYGDKYKMVEEMTFSPEVARDLLDSDQGVDISYYLANNIGKLRELTQMSESQRARAMGRLEERFSARASAGKKRSKAPATPGRKSKAAKKQEDSRYGPEDQDAFDKAFFNL